MAFAPHMHTRITTIRLHAYRMHARPTTHMAECLTHMNAHM